MRKKVILFMLSVTCFSAALMPGCKKDSARIHSKSFTEEFASFYNLELGGWVVKDNSYSGGGLASWQQGMNGLDKTGVWYGFSAYSYKNSQDEFVYSSAVPNAQLPGTFSFSSWLITPMINVKNGDKISFYTRADTMGHYTNRMQVLMSNTPVGDVGGDNFASVGDFTTLLFDINSTQAPGGYPRNWTRYEYTFTGLSGMVSTRIGFRHYAANVNNPKGIGIDMFSFQEN